MIALFATSEANRPISDPEAEHTANPSTMARFDATTDVALDAAGVLTADRPLAVVCVVTVSVYVDWNRNAENSAPLNPATDQREPVVVAAAV
jgi:hypothetical protein